MYKVIKCQPVGTVFGYFQLKRVIPVIQFLDSVFQWKCKARLLSFSIGCDVFIFTNEKHQSLRNKTKRDLSRYLSLRSTDLPSVAVSVRYIVRIVIPITLIASRLLPMLLTRIHCSSLAFTVSRSLDLRGTRRPVS